ncbi:putative zinc-finger domain-containing protein [Senna tora]|uniref:Putative zinc-finger domain-containing protein n=1 Tax=Senna tora TaxID=362788 RepID=A0A834TK71_9FABA|nr:putative zinc-finger domain-containing protein [Senna tora]
MASEAANETPNPNLPSKSREEGELSSSDNSDENPDCSAGKPIPGAASNSVPPVLNDTQGVQGVVDGTQITVLIGAPRAIAHSTLLDA